MKQLNKQETLDEVIRETIQRKTKALETTALEVKDVPPESWILDSGDLGKMPSMHYSSNPHEFKYRARYERTTRYALKFDKFRIHLTGFSGDGEYPLKDEKEHYTLSIVPLEDYYRGISGSNVRESLAKEVYLAVDRRIKEHQKSMKAQGDIKRIETCRNKELGDLEGLYGQLKVLKYAPTVKIKKF